MQLKLLWSPGNLVENADSDSGDMQGAGDFVFPTSSQAMMVLLAQGPLFENQGSNPAVSSNNFSFIFGIVVDRGLEEVGPIGIICHHQQLSVCAPSNQSRRKVPAIIDGELLFLALLKGRNIHRFLMRLVSTFIISSAQGNEATSCHSTDGSMKATFNVAPSHWHPFGPHPLLIR